MKTKSLVLAYIPLTLSGVEAYKVLKVINDTSYRPDQMLGKDEVTDLCEAARWNITILPVKP